MREVSVTASRQMQDTLTIAVERLQRAAVKDQQLASLSAAHKRWFFAKKARFESLTRVWPLGVLLVTTDGQMYATGETTRATAPGYPGHVSEERERRRELTAIAHRGRFVEGEIIHFNAPLIDISPGSMLNSESPIILTERGPLVRWNPGVSLENAQPFDAYVQERVQLLVERCE